MFLCFLLPSSIPHLYTHMLVYNITVILDSVYHLCNERMDFAISSVHFTGQK